MLMTGQREEEVVGWAALTQLAALAQVPWWARPALGSGSCPAGSLSPALEEILSLLYGKWGQGGIGKDEKWWLRVIHGESSWQVGGPNKVLHQHPHPTPDTFAGWGAAEPGELKDCPSLPLCPPREPS